MPDWNGYITLRDAARHDDHKFVYCANHLCEHGGVLRLGPLIERHGPDIGLGDILRRMRCQICGHLGAFPRATTHSADHIAKPLYCPLQGRGHRRCLPLTECVKSCRLGPTRAGRQQN